MLAPCELNILFVQISPCSQFGSFRTRRVRSGANTAGFPTCRIIRRNQEVSNIDVIGEENQVMIIYSPGFTVDTKYVIAIGFFQLTIWLNLLKNLLKFQEK